MPEYRDNNPTSLEFREWRVLPSQFEGLSSVISDHSLRDAKGRIVSSDIQDELTSYTMKAEQSRGARDNLRDFYGQLSDEEVYDVAHAQNKFIDQVVKRANSDTGLASANSVEKVRKKFITESESLRNKAKRAYGLKGLVDDDVNRIEAYEGKSDIRGIRDGVAFETRESLAMLPKQGRLKRVENKILNRRAERVQDGDNRSRFRRFVERDGMLSGPGMAVGAVVGFVVGRASLFGSAVAGAAAGATAGFVRHKADRKNAERVLAADDTQANTIYEQQMQNLEAGGGLEEATSVMVDYCDEKTEANIARAKKAVGAGAVSGAIGGVAGGFLRRVAENINWSGVVEDLSTDIREMEVKINSPIESLKEDWQNLRESELIAQGRKIWFWPFTDGIEVDVDLPVADVPDQFSVKPVIPDADVSTPEVTVEPQPQFQEPTIESVTEKVVKREPVFKPYEIQVKNGDGMTHVIQRYMEQNHGISMSGERAYVLYEQLEDKFGEDMLDIIGEDNDMYGHGHNLRISHAGPAELDADVVEHMDKYANRQFPNRVNLDKVITKEVTVNLEQDVATDAPGAGVEIVEDTDTQVVMEVEERPSGRIKINEAKIVEPGEGVLVGASDVVVEDMRVDETGAEGYLLDRSMHNYGTQEIELDLSGDNLKSLIDMDTGNVKMDAAAWNEVVQNRVVTDFRLNNGLDLAEFAEYMRSLGNNTINQIEGWLQEFNDLSEDSKDAFLGRVKVNK